MVRTDALARKLRGLDIVGLLFLPGGLKERRAEANLERERENTNCTLLDLA